MSPFKYGLGWIKDHPDIRDYTLKHPKVMATKTIKVPASMDLRKYDTPVMDQGQLGSCTANAACGMLQFYEKRNKGDYVPASRLYLYKATRYLQGTATGDTGAGLRTTLQALVMCGVPPEMYWNYDASKFDQDPTWLGRPNSSWFIASLAQKYCTTRYIRLDPAGNSKARILNDIKTCVYSNMPVVFGTYVYRAIEDVGTDGNIPMPANGEQPIGGHALCIMGYDDGHKNAGMANDGAFIIRNSWGTGWGNQGYGWLPYDYLNNGDASDFWTLQNSTWVNTADFA